MDGTTTAEDAAHAKLMTTSDYYRRLDRLQLTADEESELIAKRPGKSLENAAWDEAIEMRDAASR